MFNLIPYRTRLRKRKEQQISIEGDKVDLKLSALEEKRDLNKQDIISKTDLKIKSLTNKINKLKQTKEDKVGRVLETTTMKTNKVKNKHTNKVKRLKESIRRLTIQIDADYQYLNHIEEPEVIKVFREKLGK